MEWKSVYVEKNMYMTLNMIEKRSKIKCKVRNAVTEMIQINRLKRKRKNHKKGNKDMFESEENGMR